MDFTLKTYKSLLQTLKTRGFSFYPLSRYLQSEQTNEPKQQVILRHDVDLLPGNALQTAKIEHSLGIRSTYFFRIIPETFKPEIIQQIANLGHEIGYHYEDLTLAAGSEGRRQKAVSSEQPTETNFVETNSRASTNNRRYAIHRVSNMIYRVSNTIHRVINAMQRILNIIKSKNNKSGTGAEGIPDSSEGFPFRGPRGEGGQEELTTHAYDLFKTHLEQLRQYVPVKTICMHGSPKSRYDSKDIWKKYDYRELGIIGEPYFDINFNEVFYLTDTGRRWDGWKVSIRDKVPQQDEWVKQGLVFHSTNDIIKAIKKNRFPSKAMITTHPQRWTDAWLPWVRELVWQGVKNVVKRSLVGLRD